MEFANQFVPALAYAVVFIIIRFENEITTARSWVAVFSSIGFANQLATVCDVYFLAALDLQINWLLFCMCILQQHWICKPIQCCFFFWFGIL